MLVFPEAPPKPPQAAVTGEERHFDDQRASGELFLRYEDVSQSGALLVEAIPTALGTLWRSLNAKRERTGLTFGRGVIPILSRVHVESCGGPISAIGSARAEGSFALMRSESGDRIVLGMWVNAIAPIGRTYPQVHSGAPPEAGKEVIAGRVFAEHVLTRPFGPPDQRKVTSVPDGVPLAPSPYRWQPPESLIALPDGTNVLDAELVADDSVTVFGLDHTDSNQHVNSLVYTRLFIEAALRRLDALRIGDGERLARRAEIAYRKPSFAGERVRAFTRAFMLDGRPAVACALVEDGEDARVTRPRCTAIVAF